MLTPYYQDSHCTIYHGDCREILPQLEKVDLVLTDPPYPDYYTEEYKYDVERVKLLDAIKCHQYVFWSARTDLPMDYTAIHIWDKQNGIGTGYERIYERNGSTAYKVLNHYRHNNNLSASWCADKHYDHPSQKPVKLIFELLNMAGGYSLVLDPFMGSGTTLFCAKKQGRRAIGIEIEEKYCEIAVRRLAQSAMVLEC